MNSERTFGDWLRARRRALDLTQEELARQVGCSAITLRKLESEERKPSKQIADRLAEVLQVAPADRPDFMRFARGDPFAAPATDYSPPNIQPGLAAAAPVAPDVVEQSEAPAAGQSPFKGLRYFDEPDAALFFGREALVARLVARLAPPPGPDGQSLTRFLAVVGASGSGKSSIVRAGLIPALRPANDSAGRFERIHIITPTAHPLEALAASLTQGTESVTATATLADDLAREARSLRLYAQRLLSQPPAEPRSEAEQGAAPPGERERPRLLLVVDQFEELFTLCRGEAERRMFIDNLMGAVAPEADGPVTLVITLRADFYSHCALYAGLREALASQQEYIGPMSASELRQAIELPARLGRWEYAPGLVDLILRDVGDEPGTLPLLSHALHETWRRRRGRTLTLKSYSEAGRVQGAIATTAEGVFQSLAPEAQVIARGIFLRLTELGEGTQDTRRRVALTELLPAASAEAGSNGAVAAVLKTLSDARLITQDQAAVEVAHEALIREWPTLRQWLTENRDGLRLHRRLTEAAQEWDALNREPGELYRGPRLAQALEWASGHPSALNDLEREFLASSQSWAEGEAAQREAQRERELDSARQLAQTARQLAKTEQAHAETERQATRRLRVRNRVITAVGALAVLAAVIAAVFSNRNASLAANNAAIAGDAQAVAHTASARELALSAISNLSVDPQRGLLLALQAINLTYSVDKTVLPEAAGALHSAVSASHLQLTLQSVGSGAVIGVAFSPDGTRLATIDQTGTAKIWDASLATPAGQSRDLLTLPGYQSSGQGWEAVAYSPDGTRVATAAEDIVVTVWDAATGKQLLTLSYPDGVQAIAFSPDGRHIAIGGNGDTVEIWDAATGQPLVSLCCQDGTQGLAFSPDGTRLATANHDNQARIWDAASGKLLQTLTGHTNSVSSVAFSSDGARLATASYDGTARVWQAATGQAELVIQAESLCCVVFSPDGTRLATGGKDGVATVWDSVTGQELFSRLGHTKLLFGIAFSPDGTRLATASADGTAKVWDTSPDRELVTLSGQPNQVFTTAFSPDGARIVTGGLDRRARLWEAATGRELPALPGQDIVRSAVFSQDGKRIATAGDYSSPKIWDAASGQLLLTLAGHSLGDWSIAFSPDGTRLATGSLSGSTTVWDATSGAELLTLPGSTDQDIIGIFFRNPSVPGTPYQKQASVAFSPDGKRIVTSSFGTAAQVWEAATGQLLLTLNGHTDTIQSVAFSNDGARIATASTDGTVIVWDALTAKILFTLTGHTTSVVSVAFSPDGTQIATGSLDHTAKLWEAATGRLLQDLPGHTDGVTSVAFSPDGTRLAVGSLDGTTRLYLLKLDDLIALGKSRLTRSLTAEECQQYLHGPCPTN